jgi:decaprenyl-phosphate phosphoribosyltransferase
MFKNYFLLTRPFQWVKNVIIFIPLIFAKKLFELDAFVLSSIAFVSFILASSIIYIFNDICDLEKDKKHPIKKNRPLANNSLKKKDAYLLITLLLGLLLLVLLKSNISILGIIIIFFLLNFFYSLYFKNVVIIDLIIVSLSYVLRVLAGSIVINVALSAWLLICVFSTSLFLISFKRLAEIKISGFKSRPILKKYNNEILLKIIDVSAICSIIFYSLYTVLVNPNLIFTVPLIFVGFFRYYYLYYTAKIFEESPVKIIFSDKPILVLLILWLIIVLANVQI